MSPSSTRITSFTFFLMIGSVSVPGSFTAIPSAMVEAANSGVVPFMAWYMAGKRFTSTP